MAFQNGEYSINGQVKYFRSKWEANYALYLDYLKAHGLIKSWVYEPQWFDFTQFGVKHGATRYLPDFKVEEVSGTTSYHEVKGKMTGRARRQIALFKKHYPYKHVLIEADFFKAMQREGMNKLLKWY